MKSNYNLPRRYTIIRLAFTGIIIFILESNVGFFYFLSITKFKIL